MSGPRRAIPEREKEITSPTHAPCPAVKLPPCPAPSLQRNWHTEQNLITGFQPNGRGADKTYSSGEGRLTLWGEAG